jgi:hypothetical protein
MLQFEFSLSRPVVMPGFVGIIFWQFDGKYISYIWPLTKIQGVAQFGIVNGADAMKSIPSNGVDLTIIPK